MAASMVHVYVSAPLHGIPGESPEINVRMALRAGDQLMDEGLVPFIPHLAWYMNGYHPRDEADWLNFYALPWLERSDCVLRIGGPSKGADIELRLATQIGKPVFLSIPQIVIWKEAQVG